MKTNEKLTEKSMMGFMSPWADNRLVCLFDSNSNQAHLSSSHQKSLTTTFFTLVNQAVKLVLIAVVDTHQFCLRRREGSRRGPI